METVWNQTTELPFGYATDPEVAIEREGIYCYDRGEYRKALRLLTHSADYWSAIGDTRRWLEASIYILRIRAEHGHVEQIRELETRILRMLATENPPAALQARCHYVIGVCNTLRDETVSEAGAHFKRGIDRAIEADDKAALAYPVFGLATLLRYLKKFDESKAELEKLEMILGCVEIPEIQLSSTILKALIHNELGDHDLALQFLWNAYSQLRKHPSVVLNIHVLHSLGAVYLSKNDVGSARHYLDLAVKAVDGIELPRLKQMVENSVEKLRRSEPSQAYDFRYDTERGVIYDRSDRAIRLQTRFVLNDLALLLMREPGKVFSKEEIVRRVWNEDYNPDIHDNKIYVTIKRLRELLEPKDSTRPTSFILRYKDGYSFDPSAKVLFI